MSYSFIILDLEAKLDIFNINQSFANKYSNYEIIYCSSMNNLESNELINCFTFDANEDAEKILNTVTECCTKQNIVVIRKFVSIDEVKTQTDKLTADNQVVVFERKLSKFKSFFWNLFAKLALLIFYKELFLINNNCVTYGKNCSDVLKHLNTPSNVMRTFTWQGVNYVTVEGGTKLKVKYNKVGTILKAILPFVLSVIIIVLFFIFKNKLDFFTSFMLWILIVFGFVFGGLFSIHWFIKCQFGENISAKVNINLKGELEENEKN